MHNESKWNQIDLADVDVIVPWPEVKRRSNKVNPILCSTRSSARSEDGRFKRSRLRLDCRDEELDAVRSS
jgi:hypothetical protein